VSVCVDEPTADVQRRKALNPSIAPRNAAELAGLLSSENGAYVEALYQDWLLGREVPASFGHLFESLGGGRAPTTRGDGAAPPLPATAPEPAVPAVGILALIDAFRTHGHLVAQLDPLGHAPLSHALLDPQEFGIDAFMDRRTAFRSYLGLAEGTVRELIESLRRTYCRTFAVEYMDLRDKERRDWLIRRMEPGENDPALDAEERRRVLTQVLAAERFEMFLHKRFLGQKRFSLEGSEALIPMLDRIVEDAADLGADEIVLAMAHRGRLNVMVHTLGMPYGAMLAAFQPALVPPGAQGAGDVKYHRGFSADRKTRSGRSIHLSLQPNPSHLEWINPVAEGVVRAKQNLRGDVERTRVIPVVIHGDSAFTGQGIVPETLALSELDNYWTGGTIHVIVNNQIAFTTEPVDYRFTRHPSDIAKAIQAPIFHVNADDPEACVHAARLAIAFRQTFREDVIIDLVCYRRYGHNEGDDPTFTQPLLYKQIDAHPRVGTLYTERLLAEGVVDRSAVEKLERQQERLLEQGLAESTTEWRVEGAEAYRGLWSGLNSKTALHDEPTAVVRSVLESIGDALQKVPEGFNVHPKLRRQLEARTQAIRAGGPIDWSTAEALALGTLLREGTSVRLTGQDVERGTFSQRHAVLHDVQNGDVFVPLAGLAQGASLAVCNSMLSEAAVLGFEYGYSSVDPSRLAIWEAQFGDFANSAQVIIDQFIASGEAKWGRASGLVLLLPHGYEGQGPEHSSARLERFLQLCAQDNMQVCNLTTPAQYFHALRRQVHRNYRKPLVLMTPKSLLRSAEAVSALDELTEGSFQPVLDDPRFAPGGLDPAHARRLLLCSGKVYYALCEARDDSAFDDVAIARVEQLHPFPFDALSRVLRRYAGDDVVWVQEEPWNMGAWSFVQERARRILPAGRSLRYAGRREAASTATGSFRIHEEEEAELLREAFAKTPRARVER
jgi:2-oxoglutarate dehydrogenase E1 component